MSGPAPLQVEFQASVGSPAFNAGRLSAFLGSVAQREGATGEIAIWLCTDAEIADLHLRFMGVPGPTDVISFVGDAPGAVDAHLGDVAVSFETAARQGAEAGHSVAREIAYLALHGLLHLLGYDDLDEASRARMIGRQDEILAGFERDHPGDWG